MASRISIGTLQVVCALMLCAACGTDFDTTRQPPPRRTLGEEFFGVLCARMGAQSLPEDLSGASFRDVCHRDAQGRFAERVDVSALPPPSPTMVDASGRPVSVADQEARRAAVVARLDALARHRERVIVALDALFPESTLPVKDLGNPDPALTCGPGHPATARLAPELSALLDRMTALYGDSTLPRVTQALGDSLDAWSDTPEALAVWAELDARAGYRPPDRALGIMRPLLAYPGLRELLDASSRSLAPGATSHPSRQAFAQLVEVLHHELRTTPVPASSVPLTSTRDPLTGRELLSRPRTLEEGLSTLLLTEVAPASDAPPALVVRRDARGVAVATNLVPPFVDANGDLLPDVDALGRHVDSTGKPLPAPFPVSGVADSAPRDAEGRALFFAGGSPLYTTLDARRTALGEVLSNVRPLLATTPEQPRSIARELLTGAPVLFGSRDGSERSSRSYPPVTVSYDAFHPEDAAALELVHALTQLLGQPAMEDSLALIRRLVAENPGDVARLVGAGLTLRNISRAHPEAELAANATFRDDLLDVMVKIAREPGLLEDLLRALGHRDTLGLANGLPSYMSHRDRISYDRANLNGPPRNLTTNDGRPPRTLVDRAMPDQGLNRSLLQRFLSVVHDAHGVAFCNKAGAVVHARGVDLVGEIDLPLFGGTYGECEVFKVDDMATFYLQSIVGKARLYLRPDILRDGFIGIGAANVGVMEDSSGITGFWTLRSSQDIRPKSEWINRALSFDQVTDSPPTAPGPNAITHLFLRDLIGTRIGSSVCPERVITDPMPDAPDAAPDGRVRGLRSCAAGDWLIERTPDTLLMLETEGFYPAIRPVLTAFTKRNREDLFIELLEVMHRHWATERAPAGECKLSSNPASPACSRAGVARFELLVSEALRGDVLASLQALVKRLEAISLPHCNAVDPSTRRCLSAAPRDGVVVLSELIRTTIDPARAASAALRDRQGDPTYVRQNGTTAPQTTPLQLVIDAASAMDAAFDRHAAQHPDEPRRGDAWSNAWSRIVDQFLAVQGEREASTFANPLVQRVLPPAIDLLRAELLARCPETWTPPYARCAWIRDEVPQSLEDTVGGPAFAASWDLIEALRQDAAVRTSLDGLANHLLDPMAPHDAFASLLTTAADGAQILSVDAQRVRLSHLAAEATRPEELLDHGLTLVARVSGKVHDSRGVQLCAREMDPHAIVPAVLARLVTPVAIPGESRPRTPWEVFADAITDIQRITPGTPQPRTTADYQRITQQISAFFLDPEKGLERFYAVARKAGGEP
jgi:hypothetical protein